MADGVTAMLARVRELHEAATPGPLLDSRGLPRLVDACICASCGQWTPHNHPEAHEHDADCEAQRQQDRYAEAVRVRAAESRTLLPALAAELEAVRAGVMALAPVRVSINDWPSSECPCCEAQGPALADMLDLPHAEGCLWVRCGGVRRA